MSFKKNYMIVFVSWMSTAQYGTHVMLQRNLSSAHNHHRINGSIVMPTSVNRCPIQGCEFFSRNGIAKRQRTTLRYAADAFPFPVVAPEIWRQIDAFTKMKTWIRVLFKYDVKSCYCNVFMCAHNSNMIRANISFVDPYQRHTICAVQ